MPEWNVWVPVVEEVLRTKGVTQAQRDLFYSQHLRRAKWSASDSSMWDYLWQKNNQPYYSVYPLAYEALRKVNLDIPTNLLKLPLPQLNIRFPKNAGPQLASGYQLRSIFVIELKSEDVVLPDGHVVNLQTPQSANGIAIWVDFGKLRGDGHAICPYMRFATNLESEPQNLEAAFRNALAYERADGTKIEPETEEAMDYALHIIAGVSFLSNDPELITRDVLSKDAAMYSRLNLPENQKQIIEERATRRGKVGWTIGESWECCPHHRRPHLGFRWVGAGRTMKKLVNIRGSIVKREKLKDVPSGYDLKDA